MRRHGPGRLYIGTSLLTWKCTGGFDLTVRGAPLLLVWYDMEDWKLIEYFETGALELYHLAEDPGESHNLHDSLPHKSQELLQLMQEWRRQVDAPVPSEKNPEFVSYNP